MSVLYSQNISGMFLVLAKRLPACQGCHVTSLRTLRVFYAKEGLQSAVGSKRIEFRHMTCQSCTLRIFQVCFWSLRRGCRPVKAVM